MNEYYRPNEFWSNICKDNFSKIEEMSLLDDFKRNQINFKISLFNPEKNGIRYLKTLIYNVVQNISADEKNKLWKIKNIKVGNPIGITFNDIFVDLDYLQAIDEICFIEQNFDFSNSSILEIGAGYGRTCHTILSNYNIDRYVIIDLQETINISRSYLQKVLDKDNFQKIIFINVESIEKFCSELNNFIFDLAINIDSMAEMSPDVAQNYLTLINKVSKNFYVKNPVGKYFDPSLDGLSQGQEVVQQALQNGLLRDIINIDDDNAINKAVDKFVNTYVPVKNQWLCVAHKWAKPFSYYWQAIYKKV